MADARSAAVVAKFAAYRPGSGVGARARPMLFGGTVPPRGPALPSYEPRNPADSVLYRVVSSHLEAFLARTADSADGRGLPGFVRHEFERYLRCGVLAHGLARVRCDGCSFERLVPFSCKGRGFCPSCGGRRMTERAAHLVDAVLPRVPVRRWVLTLPYPLRYRLAWDHGLSRAVLAVYARTVQEFYARDAAARGIGGGRTGLVTVIQRFGSGVNVNVHFHSLVLDGVFRPGATGCLEFHPGPPSDEGALVEVLATLRRRVRRLLARRGVEPEADSGFADGLAEASPIMAQLVGASVPGRTALGAPAGARVWRLGGERDSAGALARGPRQAHLDGFDLHANVCVPSNDRARLEGLCRYLLRPALAQDRLRLRPDGRVVVRLKAAWRDGTTRLVFEPLEFLGKLAALTPRPEVNLLLYHGVLAPHARWRRSVVAHGRAASGSDDRGPPDTSPGSGPARAGWRPAGNWTWAALMRRAFAFDVLACPRCGARLRMLATVEAPVVVRRILALPGLSPPR